MMKRLSALDVFPTLRRYPAFWPRVPDVVPIGFRPLAPKTEIEGRESELQKSIPRGYSRKTQQMKGLRTLYSDLGALVFAGCSAAQTERIGAILEEVVRWGGPARMEQSTGSWDSRSHLRTNDGSLKLVKDGFNRNEHDVPICGQLTAQSTAKLAEEAIQGSKIMAGTSVDHVKVETETRSETFRRGIHLETETGTRQLPILCDVLWNNTDPGLVHCLVVLSTIGTGDVVGVYKKRLSREYRRAPKDRPHLSMFERQSQGRLDSKLKKAHKARSARLWVVDQLAQLEQEIWAHRSNQPVTSDDGTADSR